MLEETGAASGGEPAPPAGRVGRRVLGKTGLKVSEIGFGGHSWSFAACPTAGGLRKVTLDEAERMIRAGLEMGVNFFDSCTPLRESTVPGEISSGCKAATRWSSARCCHKMKGRRPTGAGLQVRRERLKLWQTDHFDLCMLTTRDDTPQSGYWDMSYCIEALDKVKQQGKIRFTGFGCHFTPELFLQAIDEFGDYFDVCSMPYNIRHRAAEAGAAGGREEEPGDHHHQAVSRAAPADGLGWELLMPMCGLACFSTLWALGGPIWTRLAPDLPVILIPLCAGDQYGGHSRTVECTCFVGLGRTSCSDGISADA